MLKKTCLLINSVTDSCRFVFVIIFDKFFWFSTVGIANLFTNNNNILMLLP